MVLCLLIARLTGRASRCSLEAAAAASRFMSSNSRQPSACRTLCKVPFTRYDAVRNAPDRKLLPQRRNYLDD